MNKGFSSSAINDYSVRSYVIGGYRVKVDLGCQSNESLKDIEKKETMQSKVLRGEKITGRRVQWSNLNRVAMLKVLANRDGLKCNNPNCLTHSVTENYIKKYGINWIQIDHIDNNKENNCIENYQILCSICNGVKIKQTF